MSPAWSATAIAALMATIALGTRAAEVTDDTAHREARA